MKKIILIVSLLFSVSMAESVLLVKKGWQLIGSSTPLNDMSKFTTENVKEVWHFDAKTQKWLGYSPDKAIQAKMSAKNITQLKKLKNWHGFWINSKKEWAMTFKNPTLTKAPNQEKSSDIIELKKGWNLISLPIDTVLSSDIFKDMVAWKYSDEQWELSDKTESNQEFPKLGHIKNSDGIWVKADKDTNISVTKEASKLHNFATKEEMESYIKEMATIYRRPFCGIEPLRGVPRPEALRIDEAPTTSADTSSNNLGAKNASGTNLQEKDVDESDIIKHNGKYVFYIGKKENQREHINITSFENLAKNEKTTLNKISFSDKRDINSFYLTNNKLIVLSMRYPVYEYIKDKDGDVRANQSSSAQSLIDIFDVSDIKNIKKVSNYAIDGRFKDSRVIGDSLYVINSFSPKYSITYPKEYLTLPPVCEEFFIDRSKNNLEDYSKYADCYNIIEEEDGRYYRYNYDKPIVKITDLLPEIEGSNISNDTLITPERLYASAKQKQSTNITTISKFSLSNANYLKSTSFIGNSSVEYASSKSLYMVSYGYPFYYDFNNYKSRSMIYKFNFDEDVSYKAVGSVYGTTLNQFSLSEHNDILRIATTEGFSWGANGTKNSLYTLKENNGLLDIEGVLSGLGKEGETIKSVRFMGTKAYLVTFKTSDPLYTIDLSNPKSPKKMGELEVNGYSAYLHPIGENKLLGIGQDADADGRRKGVKIELFDISDFEHPISVDTILLEKNSYSELERNHKALAFRANDNLFAFPYQVYNYQDDTTIEENEMGGTGTASIASDSGIKNYLGVYQVKGDALITYKALLADSKNWGNHRGLVFDFNNKTYISFFSDDSVISTTLTAKDN